MRKGMTEGLHRQRKIKANPIGKKKNKKERSYFAVA
jgi:hypothetical protein